MIHRIQNRIQLSLLLSVFLIGCQGIPLHLSEMPATSHRVEATAQFPLAVTDATYLPAAPTTPQSADYFDLVTAAMPLTESELTLLAQNSFVVTDRLQWERFVEAYAWIYKHDLPVIVTTDSILHAFHQSYANLLQTLETKLLQPQLVQFLRTVTADLATTQTTIAEPQLVMLYQDVHDYLAVALVLATGSALHVDGQAFQADEHGDLPVDWQSVTLQLDPVRKRFGPRVAHLVDLAWQADRVTPLIYGDRPALFNSSAPFDFTQIQPRAHYTKSLLLSNYFRAMAWLSLVEFPIVTFDPISGDPLLNQETLTAAMILHAALEESDQRAAWAKMDTLFTYLVGPADNTTLTDLDQLIGDMGWRVPVDVLRTDAIQLLERLTGHDYGQQRITGRLAGQQVADGSVQPMPRPLSFLLFGRRFAIDSWLLNALVYDHLLVDNQPVERALPTGFDLMATLGNERAMTHLTTELSTYGYHAQLVALRDQVDGLDQAFWQAPLYNQWLQLIRTLNLPTTTTGYPAAMRTAAWADKTLQTQLAAWAQLRHDHLLYAKQSHTNVQILCEFPAVYVEPQPTFYRQLATSANEGLTLLEVIGEEQLSELTLDGVPLAQYFTNVADSASLLATISEKELVALPLTATEENFLKSLVMEQEYTLGCGGVSFEEMWNGWYMHLIYGKDDSPALVADVHTNPNNDPQSTLYPPSVLHVGTGPATAMLMVVETADGPTLFVGPVYSYYEFAETGYPPIRLNDEQWRNRLTTVTTYPAAPAWVQSFRIQVTEPPTLFALPKHENFAFPGKARPATKK